MNLLPSNTALLIVDIQNDFCQEQYIQSMVKKLDTFHKQLSAMHVFTIFTRFLSSNHSTPPNMQEFFIKKHGSFKPKCLEGSLGAGLFLLKPNPKDIILSKHTYDSFSKTNLNNLLKQKKIKNLLITGVRTEICVDATAKRAFSEGYNIFLIEDLIATKRVNEELHKLIIQNAAKHYAYVFKSDAVFKLLTGTFKRKLT